MRIILAIVVVFSWAPFGVAKNNALQSAVKAHYDKSVRIQIDRVTGVKGVLIRCEVQNPMPPIGTVQFRCGNKKDTLFPKAVVRAYGKIAIAKVALAHGTLLEASQVRFAEKELTPHMVTGYFSSWKELKGKRVHGYIRPGTVIRSAQVKRPPMIASGQKVELIDEGKGHRISIKAKALEDGREGQWIRVQNDRTKRIVRAKVAGLGKLTIR